MSDEGNSYLISDVESSNDDKSIKGKKKWRANIFYVQNIKIFFFNKWLLIKIPWSRRKTTEWTNIRFVPTDRFSIVSRTVIEIDMTNNLRKRWNFTFTVTVPNLKAVWTILLCFRNRNCSLTRSIWKCLRNIRFIVLGLFFSYWCC